MFPKGSSNWIRGPQMVVLFKRLKNLQGDRASLEKMDHPEQGLKLDVRLHLLTHLDISKQPHAPVAMVFLP